MKLYVWNTPYHIDYGSTCLYAIASSEDEARKIAENANVSKYGYEPRGIAPIKLDRPPDRVHDLPYAEVYQWSE